MTATLTGREALARTLTESGVPWRETSLQELRGRSSELFEQLRSGTPGVVVINAPSVVALDVMALRWLFPAGITPLVLCPSTPAECVELGAMAARAAALLPGPVFLLLEDAVAESDEPIGEEDESELEIPDVPPQDSLDVTEDELELRRLEARLSAAPKGFAAATLDPCPPHLGRPEWLLISYGSTRAPATEAVRLARDTGQRVNHLNLRLLWPAAEGELLRAAMGIKHLVVAERNLGQYASEVRGMLPELPVVTAGSATAPLDPQVILQRLQRTPRCC